MRATRTLPLPGGDELRATGMAANPSFNSKLQLQLLPTTTTSPRLRSHQVWRDIPLASRQVDGAEAVGLPVKSRR